MGVLGKVFCFNAEEFCVFFFALLGGYPTGAKMLNELYENGRISKDKAMLMLNCCINAGPAFIISAVGTGVFNSKTVGTVLFLSHIMSSLVLALFISRKYDKNNQTQLKLKRVSLTDAFINSTAQASSAVMSICFYVILFCVITSYINFNASVSFMPERINIAGNKTATAELTNEPLARTEVIGMEHIRDVQAQKRGIGLFLHQLLFLGDGDAVDMFVAGALRVKYPDLEHILTAGQVGQQGAADAAHLLDTQEAAAEQPQGDVEYRHGQDAQNRIQNICTDRQPQGNGCQIANGSLAHGDGQQRQQVSQDEIQARQGCGVQPLQKGAFPVFGNQSC